MRRVLEMRRAETRRPLETRRVLILVLALAGTLLAGGCAIPRESAGPQAESVVAAKPGGAVRVAVTPPGSIDPAGATDPSAQLVVSTMCDTLVTIDPVTGDPRPGLAQSWIASDGGRSISFKLRKGLRFSDGSRLTSKEVVASLRRLADPSTASAASSLLADVAGYSKLGASTAEDARTLLRGVRAIEPLSFEVLFERGKHPDFVRALAHPATAPVRADLADRAPAAFAAAPVCSGPYKPAAPFKPGAASVRVVRTGGKPDQALEGVARRGAGFADEVDFRVFADAAAGYGAWRRGEVDVAPVPPDQVAQARVDGPQAVAVGPSPQVEFIAVPAGSRSPFPDAESRRALAAALDRNAIARDVYGGSRAPATGFLPPSLGRVSRPDACRFHASGARPKPPAQPLTLTFNDEFKNRQLAEAVARQWHDKLGLDVRLVPMAWDDYVSKASLGQGLDGLFRMSWSPRYQSGLEYLGPLFFSANGGGSNLERYSSVEFDRVFEVKATGAVDERERDLELRGLEDRLCQDVPLIPVLFGQSAVALHTERVAGARADGRVLTLAGAPLLRELYVR